jgi:hypothetical protein
MSSKFAEALGWSVMILFILGALDIGDFRLIYAEHVVCSINGGPLK